MQLQNGSKLLLHLYVLREQEADFLGKKCFTVITLAGNMKQPMNSECELSSKIFKKYGVSPAKFSEVTAASQSETVVAKEQNFCYMSLLCSQ